MAKTFIFSYEELQPDQIFVVAGTNRGIGDVMTLIQSQWTVGKNFYYHRDYFAEHLLNDIGVIEVG